MAGASGTDLVVSEKKTYSIVFALTRQSLLSCVTMGEPRKDGELAGIFLT